MLGAGVGRLVLVAGALVGGASVGVALGAGALPPPVAFLRVGDGLGVTGVDVALGAGFGVLVAVTVGRGVTTTWATLVGALVGTAVGVG